ncbi:hypothetical protein ACFZDK_55620 [Streptomyces sp. NPDC007901]|uniref:hypothetical protein n=1 Tax=Streptomyces sp. NPDC007901 TaxID=3364785 RepID=UPI0036E94874
MTLELEPGDALVAGLKPDVCHDNYGRYRIERHGTPIGFTVQTTSVAPLGSVLSLALVDAEAAQPRTPVEVVWGEHPGPTDAPEPTCHSVRATVQPSPYDDYARTRYRAH